MSDRTAISERSAVSRVPVEIWDTIIARAIDYDLSPSSSNGLIEALYRLQRDTFRDTAYEISERLRLALRLVCKTWLAIADRYGQRFHLGSMSSEDQGEDRIEWHRRMEFLPQPYAWIRAPKVPSHHLFATSSSSVSPLIASLISYGAFVTSRHQPVVVQEWIGGSNDGGPDLGELCNRHPNLKVLVHCLSYIDSETIPSIKLGRLRHLTYLALSNLSAVCLTSTTCIHLPTLDTLYLDFNGEDPGLSINPSLTWKTPNLKYLGIYGSCEAENENSFFFQTWIHLVQDNGRGLLGLSVAGGAKRDFVLQEEFWAWCPALRTIALEASYLGNVKPPSGNHLPLDIVLLDQAWSDIYCYNEVPVAEDILENLRRWRAESIEGLRLPVSWVTFGKLLAEGGSSNQSMLWKELINGTLQLIQERLWTFKDRFGVDHTDEKARKAFFSNSRSRPI